jgi:hypothetical protein
MSGGFNMDGCLVPPDLGPVSEHPRDNLAARVKLYNDITALTRLAVARVPGPNSGYIKLAQE